MTADSTATGLLRTVLEQPADDTPRLVYANRLDDLGEHARGEFIRVQVELAGPCRDCRPHPFKQGCCARRAALRRREGELLGLHQDGWLGVPGVRTRAAVLADQGSPRGCCNRHADNQPCDCLARSLDVRWSRGFVAEVTAPMAAIFGGRCPQCADSGEPGWVHRHGKHGPGYYPCPGCTDEDAGYTRGTGVSPGVTAALFGSHPVEKVTLSDKRPDESTWTGDGQGLLTAGEMVYGWFGSSVYESRQSSFLPMPLFKMLRGGVPTYPASVVPSSMLWYPTPALALDALSAAGCRLGRRLAGLEK